MRFQDCWAAPAQQGGITVAYVVMLIVALVFSRIAYMMARKRERRPGLWAVLGFFFGLITIIALALMGHPHASGTTHPTPA